MDQRTQYKTNHTDTHRREVGSTLERIGTGNYFLNITPVEQTLRETINKWDLLQLRSFCKTKDTVRKTKREPIEREKVFASPMAIVQIADLQNIQKIT